MRNRGFTLIELIVVITVLTMLLGIILSSFFSLQRSNSIQTERMLLDNSVISFSNLMEREVRKIGYSSVDNTPFGIIYGDSTRLLFNYDVNDNGSATDDSVYGFYKSRDTVYFLAGSDISTVLLNVTEFRIQFYNDSAAITSLPIQEVDTLGNSIQGHIVQRIRYQVTVAKPYGRDTIRVQHTAELGLKNR